MAVFLEEHTTVAEALPYVLCILGHCLANYDDVPVNERDLLHSFLANYYGGHGIPTDQREVLAALFEIALLELRRRHLIEAIDDRFADLFILAGPSIVERITAEPELWEIQRKYGKGGTSWLRSALRGIASSIHPTVAQAYLLELKGREPAQPVTKATSDDWEPLPIDRTSVGYKEAVEASEAALHEIEASNGYAATEPEERNGIVETIKGNIAALKSGFPSKRSIVEGLLHPFQFISKKFAEASIGEAAKIAVVKLIAWLFS
jgi:hypothetical protein